MVKNRERAFSVITSVAVSKYFKDIIKKYELSPTEIFRIGMGVILYEMNVEEYRTELNKTRSLKSKEFSEYLKENDKIMTKYNELKDSIEKIGELLGETK